MKAAIKELSNVFYHACRETPRGMAAPFVAMIKAVIHNPVLEKSKQR